MINFKFDDRTDIEGKISNSYVNQENPEETIRDLARYNYHVLGMKKEDNYDTILSYMTKNCSDFYEESYFKIIYRNIASAKKYKFRSVSPVKITRTEIDKIIGLNDIRKEKKVDDSRKIEKVLDGPSYDDLYWTMKPNNGQLIFEFKGESSDKHHAIVIPCAVKDSKDQILISVKIFPKQKKEDGDVTPTEEKKKDNSIELQSA